MPSTQAPKQPTWSQVKRALSSLDQSELLDLIGDLFKLNADNKVFLASRYIHSDPQTLMEPYRKAIRAEFNPGRGFPRLNLRAARKALHDFKKACDDPALIADLMIYYVEQGVICTKNYGDIDERFYDSLESVYSAAIQTIVDTGDAEVAEHFRPRMAKIVRNTSGIGWGFHDALNDMYHNDYPDENR
ncbi:MAG: DUF6155 family protein [Caldilineaceae bacterium]